jgi:hypothetical protein
MMSVAMCTVAGVVPFVLLLGWALLSSWITKPVHWDWWRSSADWAAVWLRARRVGWWRWYAPLALGVGFPCQVLQMATADDR